MQMSHEEYKNATKRTRDKDSLDELFDNLHADIMADKPLTVEELLRRDADTIALVLKKR